MLLLKDKPLTRARALQGLLWLDKYVDEKMEESRDGQDY